MLRLLRTGRWLGFLSLTVVFAIVCTALGIWQWNRREEALAAIDRLERNYDAVAQDIDAVLANPEAFDIDQQWVPVELHGTYLTDESLLLRGRVRSGAVGYDHVVPFQLDDGRIVYVDRGWLPPGDGADEPLTQPEPPQGEVTIVVRLRGNEGAITGRGAPPGQIASVDLEALAAEHDDVVYTGAYGLLATENGGEPSDVDVAERPVLDEGPHLSYCLQWFVFALLGFFAFGWALRNESRQLSGSQPPPKRRTDADEEDALLDAHEQ